MKRYISILLLCFAFNNGFSQNQQNVDSLLKVLETAEDDTNKVILLSELFWQFTNINPEEAVSYAKDALLLAKELDFKKGMAVSYRYIGLYHRNQGNYSEALDYFFKSLNIRKQIGDKAGISAVYNSIGSIYELQGNYPKALECFFKSLKIDEEQGNKMRIAGAYTAIGIIHINQGDYPKALEYLSKSLKLYEELGYKQGLCFSYNNIGIIYDYQGNYPKALEYYFKSQILNEELGNKLGMSETYNNIGVIYYNQNSYSKALEYYFKAIKLFEELGNKKGMASSYNNIGMIYQKQKNYLKAIGILKKSLAIAEEIGAKDDVKQAYGGLSEVYAELGNYQKAYEYHQLYSKFKDSLLNEESCKQIAEMQTKYETEKKEKENALLLKENEIQKLQISKRNYIIYGLAGAVLLIALVAFLFIQQNKLRARQKTIEMEQRALRTQMNPHFIFNSLNSIQKFFMENKHEKANEYLGDFGELMRKILENSSKQQITVAEEISALELYLSLEKARLEDILNYEINVDEGIDGYNTFIPPLVIQPYVENAIWHGIVPKKVPGKVTVSLNEKKDMLICEIMDDGIGFGKSKQLKIEQKQFESSEGSHEPKGMEITKERLNKVKVEELDQGTKVTIYIPTK